MPQINQLPTRTLAAGDLIPFYSSNNGDSAKTSITALASLIASINGVSSPTWVTQYKAMTGTTSVSVSSTDSSTWLILSPTSSGYGLTVTLPSADDAVDMLELTISTPSTVNITLSENGGTVHGYTSGGLNSNLSITYRFDQVNKAWYCISGELLQ